MMPYPQQQPPKKGMSGCLIAFIVVSIVGLVTALVIGIAVYAFATSKVGKTAIKVIGAGSKMAQAGVTAPGTPELRARGCEVAMVLDVKDMASLVSDLVDGGLDGGVEGLMVMCDLPSRAAPISCDDIASTYVTAVGRASADFVVTVKHRDDSRKLCEATYDPTGALVSTGSALGTPSTRGGI